MKKIFFLFLIICGAAYYFRGDILFYKQQYEREFEAPKSVDLDELKNETSNVEAEIIETVSTSTQSIILLEDVDKKEIVESKTRDEFNLKIPFSSQAPFADWSEPYKDACEEASVLMAKWFFDGESEISKNEADAQIREIVVWENENFGYYESTDIKQVLEMIHEYLKLPNSFIIENPTVEQIKKEIERGNPVVAPAAGRELKNPHFREPGPIYHMLVIRGFDEKYFYTNDPGTRHGENYRYTFDVLMSAIHDWNHGDVLSGEKAVIVVSSE